MSAFSRALICPPSDPFTPTNVGGGGGPARKPPKPRPPSGLPPTATSVEPRDLAGGTRTVGGGGAPAGRPPTPRPPSGLPPTATSVESRDLAAVTTTAGIVDTVSASTAARAAATCW